MHILDLYSRSTQSPGTKSQNAENPNKEIYDKICGNTMPRMEKELLL